VLLRKEGLLHHGDMARAARDPVQGLNVSVVRQTPWASPAASLRRA
jgi:hypothetical protein